MKNLNKEEMVLTNGGGSVLQDFTLGVTCGIAIGSGIIFNPWASIGCIVGLGWI